MISFRNLKAIISEDSYPIFHIPGNLLSAINDKNFNNISDDTVIKAYSLKPPICPIFPSSPTPPRYKKYVSYRKIVIMSGFWYILLPAFYFILGLILGIMSPNPENTPQIIILTVLIPGSIMAIMLYKKISFITLNKEVEMTQLEKDQVNLIFQQQKKEFEKFAANYSNLKEQYNLESFIFKDTLEIKRNEYLLSKYYSLLKSSKTPFRTENQIIKGKTEDEFLRLLLTCFPSEIKINMQLGNYNHSYYPDFVYESKKYSFNIDIEIDERYDSVTNKPIHYIGSNDETRNEYFVKSNWFVIRFAEEQIKNYPNECCLFIKEFIEVIINPEKAPDHSLIQLPRIKRWSYEESHIDSLDKTRR